MENALKESRPFRNPQGVDRIPPTPPTAGQTRVERRSIKIVRNNATGVYAARDVTVAVETPDPRLLASLTIGFREDGRDYPSITSPYAGHVISADLYTKNDSGQWVASNHIYDFTQAPVSPTFRAPWTYRWSDTSGRVTAKLTVPATATGTAVPPGDWWATAEWALSPGAWIADDELQRLFRACQITELTGAIVVSTTGA